MRKSKFILLISLMLCFSNNAFSEEKKRERLTIEQTKEDSVFKGVFYKVWSKLKKLTPKEQASNQYRVIATAGIRGSESTETILAPYWKGDLHDDIELSKMVKSYKRSQRLMELGDLEQANTELASFFSLYPDSYLKPNALFAQGLVSAALGDKEASGESLQRFVKEYPKHPLLEDAKTVLGEIGWSVN